MNAARPMLCLAAISVAALALLGAAPSRPAPALAESAQPGIDFFKPGGKIGKFIDMAEGAMKIFESLGMKNDQQVQQAYGESVTLGVLSRYRLSINERQNQYVSMVGLALVEVSDEPGHAFQFGVLDTDVVNAFSTPNGNIFVTRGTLKFCKDEAELAAVLGHEITHVLRQHGIQSVANAKFTDGALQAGLAAAGGSKLQAAFGMSVEFGIEQAMVKGWDKDQEFEADKDAVTLLRRANYDPTALRRFIERMEAAGKGGGGGVFSTHPAHADRIARLRDMDAGVGATMKERFEDRSK